MSRSNLFAVLAAAGPAGRAFGPDARLHVAASAGDGGNLTTTGAEAPSCFGGAPGCPGAIAGCTFADCGSGQVLGELFAEPRPEDRPAIGYDERP